MSLRKILQMIENIISKKIFKQQNWLQLQVHYLTQLLLNYPLLLESVNVKVSLIWWQANPFGNQQPCFLSKH